MADHSKTERHWKTERHRPSEFRTRSEFEPPLYTELSHAKFTHFLYIFSSLSRLTALWLSENQHKPLVHLNQETDPETGQRVLTNFMLPQTQTQVKDFFV